MDIGAFEHQAYVVTNLTDSGPGSLCRGTIAIDDDGSPISFAPTLSAGKLTLTFGPIAISTGLSITGPGAGLLTIDGNVHSRIFTLNGGAVTISGLNLADGYSAQSGDGGLAGSEGGAILNYSNLTVTNCSFFNDTAASSPLSLGVGGAIANAYGRVA